MSFCSAWGELGETVGGAGSCCPFQQLASISISLRHRRPGWHGCVALGSLQRALRPRPAVQASFWRLEGDAERLWTYRSDRTPCCPHWTGWPLADELQVFLQVR